MVFCRYRLIRAHNVELQGRERNNRASISKAEIDGLIDWGEDRSDSFRLWGENTLMELAS